MCSGISANAYFTLLPNILHLWELAGLLNVQIIYSLDLLQSGIHSDFLAPARWPSVHDPLSPDSPSINTLSRHDDYIVKT